MPLTEKQTRYRYVKENLKRIPLDVPKEKYEEIKTAASDAGESVNGYIKKAIDERMERGTESFVDAPAASSALLLPESLRTAQNYAERTGETVPQFITRAIDSQSKRDDASRHLGLNPVTGK